jgi:hypothetical protein
MQMSGGRRAVAYIQARPGVTAADLNRDKVMVTEWAASNGYALDGPVFIDRNYGSSRAFDEMLERYPRWNLPRPGFVILPDSTALAPSDGERLRKADLLERAGLEMVVVR